MNQEIRVILPLSDFYIRCGEPRLGFLNQYGIGVEDLAINAMYYKLQHIVEVEKVWFEQYVDRTPINALWQSMQGNPACRAPLDGFVRNYIDALYLMYSIYFNYYKMVFDNHHIPIPASDEPGRLMLKQMQWMGTEDLYLVIDYVNYHANDVV